MKSKQYSTLFALHLSLLLVACGPTPGPNTPSTASPTPSATPPTASSSPTPGQEPSPTPSGGTAPSTTPAPTSNPASGASTSVTLPNGSKLVISLGNRYLEAKGQTIQLQASLVDASGQPLPLSSLKLLFSSSRPQDIQVDDKGLITALVEQGFADITVIVDGTEIKASQLVSVNSAESYSGGGGGGGTPQPTATPLEDLDVDVEFEGLGVGEFQVNTYTTGDQVNSAIAIDSDGDFVVSWISSGQDGDLYGIYAQRYNITGEALGNEFQVNTYTTGKQRDPAIAMDSDGDFVVTWGSEGNDGSGYGVYAQRYNSAGTALGSEFRVNTYTSGNQISHSIAMDSDGDFVVSWQSPQDGSSDGIYAQRYNSAGGALGSEFKVNTYTSDTQNSAEIAMDSDGDFVITWTSRAQDGSSFGIYAQQYNSAGTAQGSEFQVNTETSNHQLNSAIAMDSDGDFVISWNSYGQDGSSFGIYAQRYNSAGVTQGSEFKVNTYTSSSQSNPAIAMDSDGDFVVSWNSLNQDGSSFGIYVQRYNSSGTAHNSEFRVNTYTSSTQLSPAIAMDSDGDFVVSWNSLNQDGNDDGVYAKRYNAAGQPQ